MLRRLFDIGESQLAIAVALTVIGVFFRGPGWKFVTPWHHSYIEL